jgi:hypothetical protein
MAPIPEVDTVEAAIALLTPDAKWVLKHLRITDGGQTITQAIQDRKALAICDGSLMMDIGTAAFIIVNQEHPRPIIGANGVPGKVNKGDSHRCELSSIFGIIIMFNVLVQTFDISEGAIHIACNNEQALAVLHPDFLPNQSKANFDFVNACQGLLCKSPLAWTCKHVNGHQDMKQQHKILSRLERPNVHMDKLAKCIWSHYARRCNDLLIPPHQPLKEEGWQLWNSEDKVTNPSNENLYELMQDNTSQMWWVRHGIIKKEAILVIDWESTKDMMLQLSPAERHFILHHQEFIQQLWHWDNVGPVEIPSGCSMPKMWS